MRYRTKDGDVLDLICLKYYGERVGAVEAVLEANTALAANGATLDAGLVIELPDLPEQAPVDAAVRLWD
ncbi:MAG: tail protein X [Chromatiales bacterium]|nr:tail protein X [Gammaproteobacteria bacterium]